ncbi:unnamed protein product [Brugia timori]|uniref:Exocyst complex component 5 n=1 Tax=Brugia timori TaxID=42155 RepID=A0A0R3QGL5_9BILA|nr:unnamed protein product [Brugia timori]
MTETIFDVLLRFLYTEHLDYAIDLSLAGISLAEPKTEPPNYFFSVVQQAVAITHLFHKQYDDSIFPFVSETPVEDICTRKRVDCLRNVENRINLGLERQINAVVGYIRFLLTNEQKKTDFRPEDENQMVTAMSNVSFILVIYIY